MKKILFLLLLTPLFSFAQTDKYRGEWVLQKTDSNCKHISMPRLQRGDLYKIYEIGQKSSYSYPINQDSIYYKIFSGYHRDSLPVFDFSKQELVANIYCPYCRGSGSYNNEPRHRNACSYNVSWCLREKK